ncbi:MAG: DUF1993 domain-containing protein [Dokdonella sp.]
MSLSMYDASVPVFIHGLTNLSTILDKAKAHAEAKKIDPDALLGMRLFPDMFPLSRQIQIAADLAKGPAARLAEVERPVYEDTEKTFDELQARIAKTIAFLKTLKPEQINGSEDREVSVTLRGNDVKFRGQPYLLYFALPNFYFHLTTTYALLRHGGVEIGKMDYVGPLQN